MNIVAYCASQKKKPPKTTPHSEAGSSNVLDETKASSSGAQNNVEVSVRFTCFAAGTHNNSCSQVNRPRPLRAQKLGDYRRTPLKLPFQCRYPHGCVVAVQTIAVERTKRVADDHPNVYYRHFYHPLLVVSPKHPISSLSLRGYPYQCLPHAVNSVVMQKCCIQFRAWSESHP